MGEIAYWLPLVWAALIGLAIVMYVLLDGFDLGIGMLFLSGRSEEERDHMMNAIAPYWDGNETWLVLGGAGLLVAFPLAYGTILPALYIPIFVMLLALVFRGVAFEFRFVSKPHHHWWDRAFALGSTVATFAQGVVLGGFMQGIDIQNREFAGGTFDWLTPFSLLCGVGLMAGYILLGSAWVMMKTDGDLARRAQRHAEWALYATLFFVAAVSLWTPLMSDHIAERWFRGGHIVWLWPVPFLTAVTALLTYRGARKGSGLQTFLGGMTLFLLCFLGLGISVFPYLVFPSITLWQAAAVPESQIFSLIGALLFLPLVLGYTAFVYWTFRGKVTEGEGYH
ncbi:cytochrome d ubiquinol oxidase subunit II [Rhodomicrobium sp. Az07]|uniref:cytochrome d ubiquinol oxidase subunit II n=1 Tax=Rhodomicrobium sp. Az07 TaxID=2839034 RepID=UPI002036E4E2|nr:cytochrome d ubiquinol oxidase subunit II [Rhodomicrobium sp. Az07]